MIIYCCSLIIFLLVDFNSLIDPVNVNPLLFTLILSRSFTTYFSSQICLFLDLQSSYLHSRIHGLTVFFVANFLTLPLIDFHSFTLYLFVSSTLALLINFFVYLGFSRYKIRLRKRDCLRVFKYTKDEFANILKRTTITKLYPILEVAVVNTINPLYMSIYGFSKSVISGISTLKRKASLQ